MADGERTEAATPRRRQEARARGQVARSQDLSAAVAALGGLGVLAFYAPALYERLASTMRAYLGQVARPDLTPATAVDIGLGSMLAVLLMVAPLGLGLALLGIAANVLQVGFLLSGHTLQPDFGRINPLRGLGRIFSTTGVLELGKALLKALVIGFVGYEVLHAARGQLLLLALQDLRAAAATLSRLALDLGLKMAATSLALALVDYGVQRVRLERSLRMTRHEVLEELKQSEGHPRLKSHLREMRRKLATRRMMQAVPKADVVITNPTHLAVALRYDPATMRSPHVVATGADLIAERIKALARQHGVPLVENKPLAQALYRGAEVGSEIPVALYQAVAEVLAFVYSLKESRRGR